MADARAQRGTIALLSAPIFAVALLLAVTGCGGSDRSTAAYCRALDDGTQRLKENAQRVQALSSTDRPWEALLVAFGGYGEAAQFFRKLDEAAPDEIRDDTEIVANDFDEMVDSSAGSAVGVLTGDFSGAANMIFSAIAHQGSYRRIDEYADSNCGERIFSPRSS